MTTCPSEGELKTRDLTMATYLIMRGVQTRMVIDGQADNGYRIGAWVFPDTAPIRELVEGYRRGEARSEPRAFHAALTATRRSLFAFLDA